MPPEIEVQEKLRQQLIRDEDRIEHCYVDSEGYATIGVGHLIDERLGGKLPAHIIDALLDYDIKEHTAALLAALPWVENLDAIRRAALINMAFNLGIPRMLKFVDALGAIRDGHYAQGAAHMLDSKWARQVGLRAHRLATQIETGEWQ